MCSGGIILAGNCRGVSIAGVMRLRVWRLQYAYAVVYMCECERKIGSGVCVSARDIEVDGKGTMHDSSTKYLSTLTGSRSIGALYAPANAFLICDTLLAGSCRGGTGGRVLMWSRTCVCASVCMNVKRD